MKTKILIVDDKRENIEALSQLIQSNDIDILSADDPDRALSLLLDHEFALALLDVQMPTMSGFELARLIRGVERSRHLPIIFVTAQQMEPSLIFEGYETGAVDVLFKPLDPHIVRNKVRVFVQLDQQNRLLQKQIETMSRLKEEAESANIAKSRFLANMSHEIRTPLSAVLGFSDILSQNVLSNDERRSCVDSIHRNGKLLLRIIDDVLDLSRIEAQKLELEPAPFELGELIADLKATLQARAMDKGVALAFENAFEDAVLMTDPLRLKQILLNLIGNALKFTEKGSVSVRTTIETSSKSESERVLRFSVSDTGIGLKPDEFERIFQPFVQGDSSSQRKFGGTGLGLAISKQLARSLGGDLFLARSKPGFGSTFEVSVRAGYRGAPQAKAPSTIETRVKEPAETDFLHGKKILVVDDVQDNRSLLERYLRPEGLEVGLAANGAEAIELAKSRSWDAILMDIQMPQMDGYEATRHLREDGFENPIIALTAHAMRSDLDKCLQAGCDDTMTKPIARHELLEKLKVVLH